MNQAAEPNVALASKAHSRWGIRAKVFSLVMVAVLLPTALVGTSAYWTARDVLMEKLADQLNTRARLAAASVAEWFQERDHDASVFASSTLVTSGDPALIEAYLVEVRGRFPIYSGLAVLSTEGSGCCYCRRDQRRRTHLSNTHHRLASPSDPTSHPEPNPWARRNRYRLLRQWHATSNRLEPSSSTMHFRSD